LVGAGAMLPALLKLGLGVTSALSAASGVALAAVEEADRHCVAVAGAVCSCVAEFSEEEVGRGKAVAAAEALPTAPAAALGVLPLPA
jgi:hypothetical protein